MRWAHKINNGSGVVFTNNKLFFLIIRLFARETKGNISFTRVVDKDHWIVATIYVFPSNYFLKHVEKYSK